MTIEFIKWPKTPRLFREIVITEKLDGTNSAVIFEDVTTEDVEHVPSTELIVRGPYLYRVGAQSRNRIITPGKTTDNHGFAAWVYKNKEELFEILGVGRHYGEWWGRGIQKRYENSVMRGFALFNTAKHEGLHEWLPGVDGSDWEVLVEPVMTLYKGPFSEKAIRETLSELDKHGSAMSPFDKAEGIVVFHTQSRQTYKVTLDGEDKGKWEL